VGTISSKEIGLRMIKILFNIRIEGIRVRKQELHGTLVSKVRILLPIR
jgi:hypothetical protein